MDKILDYLDTHPLVSHALLAILYSSVIMIVLGLFGVDPFLNCLISALIVTTFFYGREAGQLDHYLSRSDIGTVLSRLYTANIVFFWPSSVVMQWLAAFCAANIWCFLMYLTFR